MISFRTYLENMKELGPYTGDFLQARAALDKHEEGSVAVEEIEKWVKEGLLSVLEDINKLFVEINHFGVVTRRLLSYVRGISQHSYEDHHMAYMLSYIPFGVKDLLNDLR